MMYWTPNNLCRHYRKHPAGKDRDCWMDLLAKTIPVTKPEYEAESIKVTQNSWIEYRAEELDPASSFVNNNPRTLVYHPPARYYTDFRLIRTVANISNDQIRTCYHEHFDLKHAVGSGSLSYAKKNVETMIKYINRLEYRRRALQIRNLKVEVTKSDLPDPIPRMIKALKG